MNIPNWRQNLRRKGGFWKDGRWYDLHVERRMPLVIPMLEEIVTALPPLSPDVRLCVPACDSGNASLIILSAYSVARLSLPDQDPALHAIADE